MAKGSDYMDKVKMVKLNKSYIFVTIDSLHSQKHYLQTILLHPSTLTKIDTHNNNILSKIL